MKVLVTGCRGLLGSCVMKVLGTAAEGMDLPELDITSAASVRDALESACPDWIINCAAITDVDLCEREPEMAEAVNSRGVANLASTGARLLTVSTDQVFDSSGPEPLTEESCPHPVNVYAASKLSGEDEALRADGSVVVRTSWLFGDGKGMVPFFMRRLAGGETVRAVTDQVSSITYAMDLAREMVSIVRSGESGIFHLVNPGALSPFEIARGLRSIAGDGEVIPVAWSDLDRDAPRPRFSVLGTSRGRRLPPAWDAVERWIGEDV